MSGNVRIVNEGDYYVVMTDLPPDQVNRIGLAIYAKWLEFAYGQASLGGRMIVAPTGRYAASLSFRKVGEFAVGVIADSNVAPEAAILEHGHVAVDLKTKFAQGRPYPMHRNTGLPGPSGSRSSMWSKIRTRAFMGFASIGPNSPADSWIIPAMPAYSPSLALAEMAAAMARSGNV